MSESFARTGTNKIEQLQRQLIELQTENERLKADASLMVNNYNRKLEAQDDTIKTLGQRVEHTESMRNPDYEEMLTRENDNLKKECVVLREKVANLSQDVDNMEGMRGQADVASALEVENRRLRQDLNDKEREFNRQLDQMRSLLNEKDSVSTK